MRQPVQVDTCCETRQLRCSHALSPTMLYPQHALSPIDALSPTSALSPIDALSPHALSPHLTSKPGTSPIQKWCSIPNSANKLLIGFRCWQGMWSPRAVLINNRDIVDFLSYFCIFWILSGTNSSIDTCFGDGTFKIVTLLFTQLWIGRARLDTG